MSQTQNFAPRKARNVMLHGVRTCIGLEPAMWSALEDVARRENLTPVRLIETIDACRQLADGCPSSRLTPAIRVFLLNYYRSLSENRPEPARLERLP